MPADLALALPTDAALAQSSLPPVTVDAPQQRARRPRRGHRDAHRPPASARTNRAPVRRKRHRLRPHRADAGERANRPVIGFVADPQRLRNQDRHADHRNPAIDLRGHHRPGQDTRTQRSIGAALRYTAGRQWRRQWRLRHPLWRLADPRLRHDAAGPLSRRPAAAQQPLCALRQPRALRRVGVSRC